MKQVVKILVLITILMNQGCKVINPCEDIACFTPPPAFAFELVDKSSGENLFTNGMFNPNDIKIINLDNQMNVEFTFIGENDYNIIRIHTIGWETEIVNCSIEIVSENIFELFVDAERLNGECCSYTEIKEIQIKNSEFELDQGSGIYKILVEY